MGALASLVRYWGLAEDDEDKDCLLPLDSMRMIKASDYLHTYRLPHD